MRFNPLLSYLPSFLVIAAAVCSVANAQATEWSFDLGRDRNIQFPKSSAVIDITQAPYFAKGDGKTDDTQAIQSAIRDMMGQHRILYFPNGVYLISRTINWSNQNSKKQNAYGFNWIQGQNPTKTILRLKDRSFLDPKQPQSMMWCGGFGSADWFHNYIQDITFEIGRDNPGAIGLQFYSNNTGAIRNCEIRSTDGNGLIGLDLAHRDMNGPLLVQRVRVSGFRRGIVTGRAVNSQTFESIDLQGQQDVAFENEGQSISIRRLTSTNTVPAIKTYGTLSLIDSSLIGIKNANQVPAIINYNRGHIALRDVETKGYRRAVADITTPDSSAAYRISGEDKPGSEGPHIRDYFSHAVTSPFGGPKQSLRIPVKDPPEVPWDDLKNWAIVDSFGADPSGRNDSSEAIQKAIDSGASTIFLPGNYALSKPVLIRKQVRRVLGCGAWIDYHAKTKPDMIITDAVQHPVVIEHFSPINGGIVIQSKQPVYLKSLETRKIDYQSNGTIYLEDIATDDLRIRNNQTVYARQLNIENEGTHLTNDGGVAWILGYKTERGGTLVSTKNRSKTEIFGTFSYTTTAGKLAPMFVSVDSDLFVYFGEVCYNNDPFLKLIRETRNGVTKEIPRGEGNTIPYISITKEK